MSWEGASRDSQGSALNHSTEPGGSGRLYAGTLGHQSFVNSCPRMQRRAGGRGVEAPWGRPSLSPRSSVSWSTTETCKCFSPATREGSSPPPVGAALLSGTSEGGASCPRPTALSAGCHLTCKGRSSEGQCFRLSRHRCRSVPRMPSRSCADLS